MRKIATGLLLFLSSFYIYAHPLDMGYLEIKYLPEAKNLQVNLDINPEALKKDLKIDQLIILDQCTWGRIKSERVASDKFRLSGEASCPSANENLNLKVFSFDQLPPDYQIVGRLFVNEVESTFLMNFNEPSFAFNTSEQKTFASFIMMGIEHIGVTPEQWHNRIPEGIDHILFVFALLLLGGGFTTTVKIVTGFTLGHTLSLVLASYNFISIPSAIIEPMIALSIAYVAIEALIIKQTSHHWMVACFFGVVHGFGFSTALQELHLSGEKLITALIGFNLGVECGQILIILVALPILTLLSLKPAVFNFTTRLASITIALLGGYWFVVRVFG